MNSWWDGLGPWAPSQTKVGPTLTFLWIKKIFYKVSPFLLLKDHFVNNSKYLVAFNLFDELKFLALSKLGNSKNI